MCCIALIVADFADVVKVVENLVQMCALCVMLP